MPTDRQLLEAAATANGVEYFAISTKDGRGLLQALLDDVPLKSAKLWWNPLRDVDAAAVLMIDLRLRVDFYRRDDGTECVCAATQMEGFHEELGSDPKAATCRAIVRAAATARVPV